MALGRIPSPINGIIGGPWAAVILQSLSILSYEPPPIRSRDLEGGGGAASSVELSPKIGSVLFTDSSNTEAGSSPLKTLRILKVLMSRPLILLCSRVKSPRSASLLWYPLWRIEGTSLVALACTFSRRSTPTSLIGGHNWAPYSSRGLTNALYRASTVCLFR